MTIDKIVSNTDGTAYAAIGHVDSSSLDCSIYLLHSTDGQTWTNTETQAYCYNKYYYFTDLCYAHNKFWCIKFTSEISPSTPSIPITDGVLLVSEDGYDWNQVSEMSTAGTCGVIDGQLWVKDCTEYKWYTYNELSSMDFDEYVFDYYGMSGNVPNYHKPAFYCDGALGPMEMRPFLPVPGSEDLTWAVCYVKSDKKWGNVDTGVRFFLGSVKDLIEYCTIGNGHIVLLCSSSDDN